MLRKGPDLLANMLIHDPYQGCEADCTHDLAGGATAEELREGDGPYPADHPLFSIDTTLARWMQRRLDNADTRPAVT